MNSPRRPLFSEIKLDSYVSMIIGLSPCKNQIHLKIWIILQVASEIERNHFNNAFIRTKSCERHI